MIQYSSWGENFASSHFNKYKDFKCKGVFFKNEKNSHCNRSIGYLDHLGIKKYNLMSRHCLLDSDLWVQCIAMLPPKVATTVKPAIDELQNCLLGANFLWSPGNTT